MMTHSEMGDIFKRAGIAKTEVGVLLQIHRPMLYRWLAGVKPKQEVVFKLAAMRCEKLKSALERGELPLSKDVKKGDRIGMLQAIMLKK